MSRPELKLGFDPRKEEIYLAGLPPMVRRGQLVEEVTTAVEESGRTRFQKDRWLIDGRLIDPGSGLHLDSLAARRCLAEAVAIERIQSGLAKGETMIHFSLKNADLHYPDNCVDIWKTIDDQRVEWSRLVLDNLEMELVMWWQLLSGQESLDVNEILSHPVAVDNDKYLQLLANLKVARERRKLDVAGARRTAERMAMEVEAGNRRYTEDMILRIFSGASRVAGGGEVDLSWLTMPMQMRMVATYGCSSTNVMMEPGMMGITGSRMMGNVRMENFSCPKCEGKIPSGKGIETCPHCGAKKSDFGSQCD